MMQSSGREWSPPGPEYPSSNHEEQIEHARSNEAGNSLTNVCTEEVAGGEKTALRKIYESPFAVGYGDFCFGRLEDADWCDIEGAPEDPKIGSNSVSIPEIDSFKRTGCFDFEKLPLEIRRQIFRLILTPFFSKGHGAGHWHTSVNIKHHLEFDQDYKLSFDELQKKQKQKEEWKARFPTSSESPSPLSSRQPKLGAPLLKTYGEKKADFENTRAKLFKKAVVYPGRSGNYKLITTPRTQADSIGYIDYLFLEWVRKLSHVSKSFRNELGETFWGRSYLYISPGSQPAGCRYFEDLHNLLNDRKAACANIFRLLVDPGADTKNWPYVEENEVENVKKRFEFFADNVKLEELELHLHVHENDLEDLLAAKGRYVTATATRQLIVTKEFNLCAWIEHDEANYSKWISETWKSRGWGDDDIDSDSESMKYRAYINMLNQKYLPMMRDLMLPNTLREKTESQGW